MDAIDFSAARKSTVIHDERGRPMRFPNRRDYVEHLVQIGAAADENALVANAELSESVYLDWLKRGQVGCVFAQLLGRPRPRRQLRTVVIGQSSGPTSTEDRALQISAAVQQSVAEPEVEGLTVLLPNVVDPEPLVRLLHSLSALPDWTTEREWPWRRLIIVGLRVSIENGVWAEVLGLGPFQFLPPTRQSPITSLEIRTKTERAKYGKINPEILASHLADIPTYGFLTNEKHRRLFTKFTPALRHRILGGSEDQRAKAGVTFAVPAVMWYDLKGSQR